MDLHKNLCKAGSLIKKRQILTKVKWNNFKTLNKYRVYDYMLEIAQNTG
jgi:hypothetical protein